MTDEQAFVDLVFSYLQYGDLAERIVTYLQTAPQNTPQYRRVCEILDTARARRDAHMKAEGGERA